MKITVKRKKAGPPMPFLNEQLRRIRAAKAALVQAAAKVQAATTEDDEIYGLSDVENAIRDLYRARAVLEGWHARVDEGKA